jgi:hypothetical protein
MIPIPDLSNEHDPFDSHEQTTLTDIRIAVWALVERLDKLADLTVATRKRRATP